MQTVMFTCESEHESQVIGNSVNLYRHILSERGVDPTHYGPYPEGVGISLDWNDVQEAAVFIKPSTMTRMSIHMARAIREALLYKEKCGKDPEFSKTAGKLAARLTSEIWWAETTRL
ncbi:hypothetical protein F5X71_29615 [Nocardia brasiliensis]|uniref:Uncharacterized protein n=1 Tax=Nocardia brasiliensis TaxID=37326 RepID=A0A6G9XY98_NOCBR|nr:hypothetical protein [Nocardia brasiliensis]QIS05912.1 hypothetical protein F5X71_29615 [Nocardia brasiliensis]